MRVTTCGESLLIVFSLFSPSFFLLFFFSRQDTLLKVKGVLVDDKKHIRYADWSANDVSLRVFPSHCRKKHAICSFDRYSTITTHVDDRP